MTRTSIMIMAALAVMYAASPCAGQISTRHFKFVPDEGSTGLARRLSEVAEARRGYVLKLLGTGDDRVIEVRIASSQERMMEMVGTSRPVSDWIAGLAMSDRDLIVLSARGNEVFKASDTFVHELAHVYLDSALAGRSVPRWFNEGFAMLVASEQVGDRLKVAMGAAATDSYLPLDEITRSFPAGTPTVHLAYAQSMLFVRHLNRLDSHGGIPALIREVRTGMPFDLAFSRVFGSSVDKVWEDFKGSVNRWTAILWVLSSTALLWILVTLLFLYVYVVKRRRTGLRKEAWEIQDEIDRIRMEADRRGIDPYDVQ